MVTAVPARWRGWRGQPGALLRAARMCGAWLAMAAATFSLDGCAVAALPCRVVAATLKVVPVVGHTAAVPFDACADVID
ncbi:DUF6726 family protein [Paraburkholderia kururiensis]|uniref:DUF6726 family protein n=1 Tax=Paraburkholderia kururiensis TaxID=984307 RepID=UPI000B040839|nr:DUF6726 family protein [Paraburkholderia kururiensis]